METPRNARFWVFYTTDPPPWCNVADFWGHVKVTLAPGESLEYHKSEPTEEGWSSESVRWTHMGDYVLREWSDCGSDCDGRLDRFGSERCDLDRLQSVPRHESFEDGSNILMPYWEQLENSQRDYAAEAMGY